MEYKRDNYLNKTELKSRGWTESSIDKFLGVEDTTRNNPFYRSAAPIKLYLKERVEQLEDTEQFKIWFEKSGIRKQAAKNAADVKRKSLLEEAKTWKVKLKSIPLKKLYELAVDSHNDWSCFTDNFDNVTSVSELLKENPETLNRLAVNYLRHECSSYEHRLDNNRGKVGVDEAYYIIKTKVLQQIAKQYPQLKEEANKQLSNLNNHNEVS